MKPCPCLCEVFSFRSNRRLSSVWAAVGGCLWWRPGPGRLVLWLFRVLVWWRKCSGLREESSSRHLCAQVMGCSWPSGLYLCIYWTICLLDAGGRETALQGSVPSEWGWKRVIRINDQKKKNFQTGQCRHCLWAANQDHIMQSCYKPT